jgi:predicted kinase
MEIAQVHTDTERLIMHLGPLPEPVAQPVFIIVSGLPGTGKSYFSQRLAEKIPLVILESDDLRKVLFPRPAYTQEESSYLFKVCHGLIEFLLKKGISLVLDATNLSERNREYLYSISERLGIKRIIVRITAPQQVVQERLQARTHQPANRSDADWEVYRRMKSEVEKITRNHYVVDTSRDITTVIDRIVKEINRQRRR